MTDIIERLRQSVTKGHEPTDELVVEAANEIECLQRCLNERDDFLGKIGQWEAFITSLPRGVEKARTDD